MRPAAVIGWTGKGSIGDLEKSVRGSLAADRVEGVRTNRAGKTLIGSGVDPVTVSRVIANLPGVRWIALGYEFSNGLEGLAKTLTVLSRKYLRRGLSFNVSADAKGRYSEGDVILTASSTVLSTVKGTRVEENTPGVRFRVSLAGSAGACGVQIREGVGGVPTSGARVARCLVSGGRHSSVAAWMCALAGFSPRLVHARVDDASLRQVAKLYSELSYRMDPSSVSLEVLEGAGSPAQVLASWLRDSRKLLIIAGAHLECDGDEVLEYAQSSSPSLLFPILILQEEEVEEVFRSLGLKETQEAPSGILGYGSGRFTSYRVRKLKRGRMDVHAVLDSLLS